jgi:hypothetical protein
MARFHASLECRYGGRALTAEFLWRQRCFPFKRNRHDAACDRVVGARGNPLDDEKSKRRRRPALPAESRGAESWTTPQSDAALRPRARDPALRGPPTERAERGVLLLGPQRRRTRRTRWLARRQREPLRIQVGWAPLPPSTHTSCVAGRPRGVVSAIRGRQAQDAEGACRGRDPVVQRRAGRLAATRLARHPGAVDVHAPGRSAHPATSLSVSGVAFGDCPGTSYSASTSNRRNRAKRARWHFSFIDNVLDIRGPV